MNIFKEYTENQKRVKERIKREKDADKEKHDRMMDRARTRDTRRKNAMTESEIHVRLDHLDGDSRQKKAGAVMRKHERAGHIEYVGNTDKGVVFKAKSKQHADRLHRELKPHATGVEHMNEEMVAEISKDTARSYFNKVGDKSKKEIEKRKAKGGPQRAMGKMYPDHPQYGTRKEERSAQDPDIKDREGTQPAAYHKGLKKTTKAKRDAHFKKHGKKADNDASAYKDAPGDKKARKGNMPKSKYTKFVDNMMKEGTDFAAHRAKPKLTDSDRKKMAKVADMLRKEREKKAAMKEAMGDAEHKAAVKHITDLGKKNNKTFGQQRMHIDNHPGKHDEKTRQAAKTINKNQFGNWKKGKDGKMTQEGVEQTNEGAYKGKDAFGRGVIGRLRGGKAGAYLSKKAKERSDMNKKNDPGSAKKGYALSVTDKDKAMAKARKKGLSPKHPSTNYNRKLPEEKQKKDHQTISYVTHGGQKGKVQVHKDNAFKALNHYRKNNKSAQFEAMSPESRKAHGRMFKAAAKKKYDVDTKAAAQAEREKRLKAKGWVKNDRGGMSKVSEEADKSLAAKAAKSGISVGTLKKVYNRGVAAWKTGHRPGTTPSQWGHARVNAFIAKKKKGGLNHDKDLA